MAASHIVDEPGSNAEGNMNGHNNQATTTTTTPTAAAPSSRSIDNSNDGIEDGNAMNGNGAAVVPLEKAEDGSNMPRSTTGTGTVTGSFRRFVQKSLSRLPQSFATTALELGQLSDERTRTALITILENGARQGGPPKPGDVEQPSSQRKLQTGLLELIDKMKASEAQGPLKEHSPEEAEADRNAEEAANVLTTLLLKSNVERGIDPRETELRKEIFGSNAIADQEPESFLSLCMEAVQDFVLIMLIVLGIVSIAVETTIGLDEGESCGPCWIEGTAILITVLGVVMLTASIDYAKQFAFIRLTRSLHETNTKSVIRDGKLVSITDDDIVVGDILSVNSHNLASIPADCVLLGPTADLKMDESTLTGESKAIMKRPGDVVLSGTTASEGSGKMVVIAVGVNSVAGRIKARVYNSASHEDGLSGEDEHSPLTRKLDTIAKQIGVAGTVAASVAFIASCIIGLAVQGDEWRSMIDYLIVAITVLAVAVPEGLPLAVTLALAFSSSKMMKDQNLVKHLDACETMGCATTICTDKTGTLTANKMTVRAMRTVDNNYLVEDPGINAGDYVVSTGCPDALRELVANIVAVDTMNETVLYFNDKTKDIEGASGNPTEVALLHYIYDMGYNYDTIRNSTRGRSAVGAMGEHLSEGKMLGFTSARKMMSWAVPKEDGSYRVYVKGAQEVVFARCTRYVNDTADALDMTEEVAGEFSETAQAYARRGMRCLGLAYVDLPQGFVLDKLSDKIKNSDGTPAYEAETNLVAVALMGIEDPLRAEVPGAIAKCYEAGIDVRLVTGDNPNTAVSIAYQAGILQSFHFQEGTSERVALNLKPNVLMTGADFRAKVHRTGDNGTKEFDQASFDKVWPYLRVLARSSPDDKLTLAHGLNQSTLFTDTALCEKILKEDNIRIFPDRQVVAMTGDGTNDAPALKRADIGFAMGIAGTQIAKDAADIILLDDNFASIVTAAKWGRNIYASIQKFLQFQLTVNISAVVTALTGAFAYQTSPLAAIQLLWVNLLMDSLASLALASEPPVDELLQKPPVNRAESMITKRMWGNMLGQSAYQIIVVMVILFAGPDIFDIEPGHEVEDRDENSVHYTIIFNAFVWMQLFNEINCRNLKGEFNVFRGVLSNRIFCSILVVTAALQVLIVQYGSIAFHVSEGGLERRFWGVSMILGMGSLPVQQVINLVYRAGQSYKGYRMKKRVAKNGALSTRRTDGSHRPHRE